MGLRRRLSKKWNETVNGVLNGPGVNVNTVNTDDQTINQSVTWPDGSSTTTSPAGLWTEDPNSPLTGSGTQEHTITLADSYEKVLCLITNFDNTSGGSQDLEFRLNGVAGSNYFYRKTDGSTTTNTGSFVVVQGIEDGKGVPGTLNVTGTRTIDGTLAATGPLGEGANAGFTHGTIASSALSNDLQSITFRGNSGNISVDVSVYGWSG